MCCIHKTEPCLTQNSFEQSHSFEMEPRKGNSFVLQLTKNSIFVQKTEIKKIAPHLYRLSLFTIHSRCEVTSCGRIGASALRGKMPDKSTSGLSALMDG